MATPPTDLFPETLLVSLDGSRIYTTSVKVAEYFGKKHKNVLRAIDQILADLTVPPMARPIFQADHGLSFEPMMIAVTVGKGAVVMKPAYRLTHDDFMLVAMNFNGVQAQRLKVQFIAAFRLMEAQLNVLRDRYVGALDILCPPLRPAVERTQAGQDRVSIASVIGKSCASVTYYRAKARRLGLLGAAA